MHKKLGTRIKNIALNRAGLLFAVQMALSGLGLSIIVWKSLNLVKAWLLAGYKSKVTIWTFYFFHPLQSDLFNYIALCIALGAYGILIYFLSNKKIELIKKKAAENCARVFAVAAASLLCLSLVLLIHLNSLRLLFAMALFLSPLLAVGGRSVLERGIVLASIVLLFLMLSEIIMVLVGPVRLANEYCDIYGETYLNKYEHVNNLEFLRGLKGQHVRQAVEALPVLMKRYGYPLNIAQNVDGLDRFTSVLNGLKKMDLRALQDYVLQMIPQDPGFGPIISNSPRLGMGVSGLHSLDIEAVKNFYFSNSLEYSFQNMTRGQINHIGQILNPINQYINGVPLSGIYIQYGLGDTFIFKWTMDLLGGISINNYYKCYFYYILYFALFLLMLYILFNDKFYVLTGAVFFAVSFFAYGYIGFILAPGILPIIHFFDAVALMFLVLFFRRGPWYLALAVLFSLAGVAIDGTFGSVLALALAGALALYATENTSGVKRFFWMAAIPVFLVSDAMIFHFESVGTLGKMFKFFLIGFFSWHANNVAIAATMLYLIVSYLFLFMLRNIRHNLKYIYLFTFIYAQGMLVYYYWAGLPNHFPMVVPFGCLQLLLMIYILEKVVLGPPAMRALNISKRLLLTGALLLASVLCFKYYAQKSEFGGIFSRHKVYSWNFKRARLISTIDPAPVRQSVELIRKYSPQDRGIYIISKYDNLLPFIAGRSSLMPYVEMPWHFLTNTAEKKSIDWLQQRKPLYLFVDTDIDHYDKDPWAILFNGKVDINERASRMGRYAGLYDLFQAVKGNYEKIDEGGLLTVYKRKP